MAQFKRNNRLIETDQNEIVVEMELDGRSNKPIREEIFNLKNKDCQKTFFEETEKDEEQVDSFKNDLLFDVQSMKWKKACNNILHKCFKKVRIVNKKEMNKADNLLKERIKLKNKWKSSNIDDEMKRKIKLQLIKKNI